MRRRLRIVHEAFAAPDVDELDLATIARRLRLEEGLQSERIAREDVRLVAEALGWAEERRSTPDGARETWFISPRLQAEENADDADDAALLDAAAKRSVTRTLRAYLLGAYTKMGRDFYVPHARVGHHVEAVTAGGDHDLNRFLNRGVQRGEFEGSPLLGWRINPKYQPRRRRPSQ